MDIIKTENNGALTIALKGRLDAMTSRQLEAELKDSLQGVRELEFNLGELEYISSAGLRVLHATGKIMRKQGAPMVCKVKRPLLEIFEVTGFLELLNIQEV